MGIEGWWYQEYSVKGHIVRGDEPTSEGGLAKAIAYSQHLALVSSNDY
ncbi:hypothetical protein ACM0P9_09335 [Streptococcus pluranimalium]